MEMKPRISLSVARWGDPVVFAFTIVGTYGACRSEPLSNTGLAMTLVGVVTLAMCLLELARAPWRRTPAPDIPLRLTIRRSTVKSIGAVFGFGCVLLAWHTLPEYARPNYRPLFEALSRALPAVPPITAVGIFFTEWRLGPAADEAWHFGLLVMGRWRAMDWAIIRDGLLGWLVKGFFLPINFCALVSLIGEFRGREAAILTASWSVTVSSISTIIFATLVVAIIPGYLFSSRLLGTENRNIDRSWFGWSVTLSCYPPLVSAVFDRWFNYYPHKSGQVWEMPWAALLQNTPTMYHVVGCLIILFELVHYWGEAIFGLRSSNLTNRGVITSGPYRFCKHPVYLVKCLGWLLIWMPFAMGDGILDATRLTVLWGCVCGIYLMRAWVEERLLASDPNYVAYALWIDQRGLFAPLGRTIPPFSFKWRLERWNAVRASISTHS